MLLTRILRWFRDKATAAQLQEGPWALPAVRDVPAQALGGGGPGGRRASTRCSSATRRTDGRGRARGLRALPPRGEDVDTSPRTPSQPSQPSSEKKGCLPNITGQFKAQVLQELQAMFPDQMTEALHEQFKKALVDGDLTGHAMSEQAAGAASSRVLKGVYVLLLVAKSDDAFTIPSGESAVKAMREVMPKMHEGGRQGRLHEGLRALPDPREPVRTQGAHQGQPQRRAGLVPRVLSSGCSGARRSTATAPWPPTEWPPLSLLSPFPPSPHQKNRRRTETRDRSLCWPGGSVITLVRPPVRCVALRITKVALHETTVPPRAARRVRPAPGRPPDRAWASRAVLLLFWSGWFLHRGGAGRVPRGLRVRQLPACTRDAPAQPPADRAPMPAAALTRGGGAAAHGRAPLPRALLAAVHQVFQDL